MVSYIKAVLVLLTTPAIVIGLITLVAPDRQLGDTDYFIIAGVSLVVALFVLFTSRAAERRITQRANQLGSLIIAAADRDQRSDSKNSNEKN